VVAFEGPENGGADYRSGVGAFFTAEEGHLGDVLVRVLEDEHYPRFAGKAKRLAHDNIFRGRRLCRALR